MQVRQVPDRQELGQCKPPCSSESSKLCVFQASKLPPSGAMRALKKGISVDMVAEFSSSGPSGMGG
jgi:hypothetical protein